MAIKTKYEVYSTLLSVASMMSSNARQDPTHTPPYPSIALFGNAFARIRLYPLPLRPFDRFLFRFRFPGIPCFYASCFAPPSCFPVNLAFSSFFWHRQIPMSRNRGLGMETTPSVNQVCPFLVQV